MDKTKNSFSNNKYRFYFSVGLAAIIVVPSLFIMAITFAVCSIIIIGYPIVGLIISLPDIIQIGTMVYTGIHAVIIAIIGGSILFALAILCWKFLKKFLSFVSSSYRNLDMKK